MQSRDSLPASSRLGALSIQVLVKTALKSVIWLGLAWAITRFYPDATWAWYVALAFIAIGVLSSLIMLAMAVIARRRETARGG